MDKDPHKIEHLQQEIYSRGFHEPEPPRTELKKAEFDVDKQWKHDDAPATTPSVTKPGKFFKKILVGSIIFFLISIALALFMFFWGFNIVSTDKVDIAFVGPVAIGSGETLSGDFVFKNDNNTQLLNAVAYIQYPDGSKDSLDITKDLLRVKEDIGTVNQKTSSRVSEKVVLFGAQNETKDIKVTFEYSVQGSSATFKKEKTIPINITSSPLTLTVQSPQETVSGQDLQFAIDVTSNSATPLSNILVRVDYPFGFSFNNSIPKASYDSNVWKFDTLAPGEHQHIVVTGRLDGEQNDSRTFRFSVGMQNADDEKKISTAFITLPQTVSVRKPPVGVTLSLGKAAGTGFISTQGEPVTGTLVVINNLPVRVVGAEITARFSGNAMDFSTPRSAEGFYRSIDQMLLWNQTTMPALAVLDPGETVNINFDFSSIPFSAGAIKNGSIVVDAQVTGKQTIENSVAQSLSYKLSRELKIQSAMSYDEKTYYTKGPFRNTGPIPPRVDQKTTYTLQFVVANTSNAISNAKLGFTLPTYVRWMGNINPSSEIVSWNSDKNEVVWQVGDIPAADTRPKAKQISFQVELQPSISQLNQELPLTSVIQIQGLDNFTNQQINIAGKALTTDLSADSGISAKGSGTVTR